MSIKVKVVERNIAFNGESQKFAYVLQPDLHRMLSESKVIKEASQRSGISCGSFSVAWNVIGEVIKAWTTGGTLLLFPDWETFDSVCAARASKT